MISQDDAGVVGPRTLAWVSRHLEAGERVLGAEALHGGITAEMRRLTIGTRGGGTRQLVLRSFVAPMFAARAGELLDREARTLALLAGTAVRAPEAVAVDPDAAQCAYPSLLMTCLPGRTVLDDEGLASRMPLLARRLVTIHAVRPAERQRTYEAWTTADAVVAPRGAATAAWAAAADVIRRPAPPWQGRFLHRDFHPGNVLFDGPAPSPAARAGTVAPGHAAPRISGVVDWVETCWGPADLDVAHCSTNLALLHDPSWGPRFADAYEEAGGVLAGTAGERLYWRLLDALAFAGDARRVARPWQEAGRTELTARAVEARLDAYVGLLLDTLG
ncbi:aminoglycoside phosphotransferase [Streptomyces zinciresistens K42]|uniref:Aminoglycoside phosphotransferase n=1 Tax=Streptomyces zinciresistens K42 TaxID=700597 RepID=G2GB64_9ACTN|nr:aminoglycoside phosphotransferase family protein [Streptomyces zinciresistens]EGX59241.1 aminoglycoside phosphotransferase [Streptomyces zinciresistens K42]